ncbi:nucleoside deaminase [Aeromonas sanarellii]|uniref:nucleoside deaminase n=1 Tax=Aeromonas sanarellii TaxID=633415 RepID=UPI002DBA0F8B|nr:nucleoside deaminase [Aeromonas sanarellii]MEB6607750.1 nucleoside deaminase [Aeromonas sanarellii]
MDYMKLAVDATIHGMENKIGGPFGATIVRNGEVVVAISNTMMRDTDPSAHAELVAIREACKKLDTFDLSDCEIYATCEPCPMCVSVIIWTGIKKVYYCNTHKDAHVHGFSDQHLRDYLSGKDTSCLEMINVEKRADCDHLFEYFHELQGKK